MILTFFVLWFVAANLSRLYFKQSVRRWHVQGEHAKRTPVSSGMSGAEVVQKLRQLYHADFKLEYSRENSCYQVKEKTVCLDYSDHNSRSVSAMAYAAHEVGHALQHQENRYPWMLNYQFRVAASYINSLFRPLLAGMFLLPSSGMLAALVACYTFRLLYARQTVLVEQDATRRALESLQEHSLVSNEELVQCQNLLLYAGNTYKTYCMTVCFGG